MWKWNFKGFCAQRGSESPDVVDSQRRAAAIPRVAVVPGTGTIFAGPGRGSGHGKWMEIEDNKIAWNELYTVWTGWGRWAWSLFVGFQVSRRYRHCQPKIVCLIICFCQGYIYISNNITIILHDMTMIMMDYTVVTWSIQLHAIIVPLILPT